MDDVVLVGAAASPPPQAAPAPADVDDEADADDGPVLTAAERGLTLETWQDRPVSKANNQQQVRPSARLRPASRGPPSGRRLPTSRACA